MIKYVIGQSHKKDIMIESYNTIAIILITLVFYFGSFLLVKFDKIKKINQRRFWNVILLFSFLASAIIGIVLAVVIDYGFVVPIYPKLLTLHVKTGVVMAVIAFLHTISHWRYYWLIVKKKN